MEIHLIFTINNKLKISILNNHYSDGDFKFCFSLLAVISLIRVGHTTKVRLSRLKEINDSFLYEKARNKALSKRYDDLISFEGEQRFMKDQYQMISRDVIRVIWR